MTARLKIFKCLLCVFALCVFANDIWGVSQTQAGGAFFLDSFKLPLINNNANLIYFRTAEIKANEGNDKYFWVHTGLGGYSIDSYESGIGNFNTSGYELTGGYNLMKTPSMLGGLLVQYNFNEFTKDDADGSMADIALGGYGNYLWPVYDSIISLTGTALLGFSDYSVKRQYSRTARSEFDIYSLRYTFDIEYATGRILSDRTLLTLKPFMNFAGGFAHNGTVYEQDGGPESLKISRDTYARLDWTIIGGRLVQDTSLYSLNASLGLGYLLIGNNALYDVEAQGLGDREKMKPTEESLFYIKMGGYGKYKINTNFDVSLNADLKIGSNIFGYWLGLGAAYRFYTSGGLPAEPAEMPTDESVKYHELTSAVLSGAAFDNNSYTLKSGARRYLESVAKRLQRHAKNSQGEVIVEGFAASDEKDPADLAYNRALVVARELSRFGLKVRFKGADEPVNPALNDSKRTRRVEIKFISQN
jgi:outer membrane protein OmpA-like peptidoglycan-associated protein